MNLLADKKGQHGQFADGMAASALGMDHAPHRNGFKADRYVKRPLPRTATGAPPSGAEPADAENRRYATRRSQPTASAPQRKTASDRFFPPTGAGESIVVVRNDRRKARLIREELQQLSMRLLNIQEGERRRIAADLHDGIGQSLNLLKVSMESMSLLMQRGAHQEAAAWLQQIIPQIRSTMAELRGITMDLRPAMLEELGLIATLSRLSREFETACRGIKVELHVGVEEHDVPAPLKSSIFRIVQEALNNIAKHAHASRVTIALSNSDGKLRLSIEDNGLGFAPSRTASRCGSGSGLGLLTMKERARSSNGDFAMQSIPGEGTRILATWRHAGGAIKNDAGTLRRTRSIRPGEA